MSIALLVEATLHHVGISTTCCEQRHSTPDSHAEIFHKDHRYNNLKRQGLTVADLTGSVPSPLAGSTQDFNLKTAYYEATVPLWIDLIVTPSEWSAAFLSEEAKEVLGVLGGLVVVFPVPTTTGAEQTRDLIRCIGDVVKHGLGGWEWDGVGLAVGVGDGRTDEWDEMCAETGLEFVHLVNSGIAQDRNEFGGEFSFTIYVFIQHDETNIMARKNGHSPSGRGPRSQRLGTAGFIRLVGFR